MIAVDTTEEVVELSRAKKGQNQMWKKTWKQGRHTTHQALKCNFFSFHFIT